MIREQADCLPGRNAAKTAARLDQMSLDRMLADAENPGNLLHLVMLGGEVQDFPLPLG